MQTQTPVQSPPQNTPYIPTTLTHISQIHPDGRVDLAIRIYLPSGLQTEAPRNGDVRVKVGPWRWVALDPPQPDQPCWSADLDRIRPGTALRFQFRNPQKKWQTIAPLADLERVYQVFYVPDLNTTWKQDPPAFNRARIVMETTLEGLLAGYEGGIFAPRSREEMFTDPITRQILRTDIPNRLAELGIDQLMVTTSSAVADRSYLNPRFNYLTFDVADVDWQLGQSTDFFRFLERLYASGISLIPDLTSFAHQVRTPFEGALDQIDENESTERAFVDMEAYKLRDFGTWMFKLEDPILRRQIIEKIISFVRRYRLQAIRLGYLDGVLMQYSNRETNYGEILIKELRAELRRVAPETYILGETFKTRESPTLEDTVDIFYTSYGFAILEEICRPPELRSQPLVPNLDRLVSALQYTITSQSQNAVYAQLHDEICPDNYVSEDRPETPWAYGANPAELARLQGEKLIELGVLPQEDLLDYVRRTVRSVEALTLFTANLMYMFVPGVDSLMLGSLETPGNWRFYWDDVAPEQLEFWQNIGLSDRQIYLLHKQHRLDMARLRQIFRDYTYVDPDPVTRRLNPCTQVHLHWVDQQRSLITLWRLNPDRPAESLLILFNLGPQAYKQKDRQQINLPLPGGFEQEWEVLFDGDWLDPLLKTSDDRYYLDENVDIRAYAPGTLLSLCEEDGHQVLPLEIGAYSLIVLKIAPTVELNVERISESIAGAV